MIYLATKSIIQLLILIYFYETNITLIWHV